MCKYEQVWVLDWVCVCQAQSIYPGHGDQWELPVEGWSSLGGETDGRHLSGTPPPRSVGDQGAWAISVVDRREEGGSHQGLIHHTLYDFLPPTFPRGGVENLKSTQHFPCALLVHWRQVMGVTCHFDGRTVTPVFQTFSTEMLPADGRTWVTKRRRRRGFIRYGCHKYLDAL